MERLTDINPARIAWCADQIGLAPSDMASELGISANTISRLLDGEGGVTFRQLRQISKYFGRSVFFFLESTPVRDETAYTPQFRTLANQAPEIAPKVWKIIRQAETQRERYFGLLEELRVSEIPVFEPPDIADRDVTGSARVARKWLGIDRENSFDTYRESIERVGILVFRSNGYNGQWQVPKESTMLGFSLYQDTCPVIFVRKQVAEARQTFTLTHELGHLLLHHKSAIDSERDFESDDTDEREANQFAGAFLVPDAELVLIGTASVPDEPADVDDWLKPIQQRTGASGEVVLRRLLDSGRVTSDRCRAYCLWKASQAFGQKEGGNRGYCHREPIHMFGDRFVRAVLDGISTDAISLTKASRYLDNLKLHDIHALEEYYASI
ncbi:MAG: ImmA/IrrE family metallo-endopeptidase [Gammaproteobacteria bacterium]|nr:ImmA/IrrE family metallo-endopeptidase [Gammaproteobacteria bacterium]